MRRIPSGEVISPDESYTINTRPQSYRIKRGFRVQGSTDRGASGCEAPGEAPSGSNSMGGMTLRRIPSGETTGAKQGSHSALIDRILRFGSESTFRSAPQRILQPASNHLPIGRKNTIETFRPSGEMTLKRIRSGLGEIRAGGLRAPPRPYPYCCL